MIAERGGADSTISWETASFISSLCCNFLWALHYLISSGMIIASENILSIPRYSASSGLHCFFTAPHPKLHAEGSLVLILCSKLSLGLCQDLFKYLFFLPMHLSPEDRAPQVLLHALRCVLRLRDQTLELQSKVRKQWCPMVEFQTQRELDYQSTCQSSFESRKRTATRVLD